MGAIGGLLGLNGGANGSGYAPPTLAPVAAPTTVGQAGSAYTANQNALAQQEALLAALRGQNGLGNQSQIYDQFQGVVNGTGPNPAQAELAQATGANVANQAALAAGQRGAGANVGLIARQAAQTGAATQQNAVGQAATLEANQSLNALNSAGAVANTQAANEVGQTNANTTAQQAEQANVLNAIQGQNAATVTAQGNVNAANAGLANTNIQGQQAILGGVLNSVGPAASMIFGAEGGEIPRYADGGESAFVGPQSKFGQFLSGVSATAIPAAAAPTFSSDNPGAAALKKGTESGATKLAGLLKSVPKAGTAIGAPGATDLPDMGAAFTAAKGGMTSDYRGGGKVDAKSKSQKATAPGNNYANDKIPAVLSEHEIVIPRSVTMGKDPINGSARFVAAVLAKRRTQRAA